MGKTDTGQETLEIMEGAKFYNDWTLSFFVNYLEGEILEIGGGIGNFTKLLTNFGKVTSIEVEKNYIPRIRKTTKGKASAGLGNIEKGEYFFKSKNFDTAIMINVLEHIKDDTAAVSNINKLLKKSGVAVILVPAHQALFSKMDKNLGHHKRYTTKSLNLILKDNGFKILETRYLNIFGMLGWFVNGKILKKEIIPGNQLRFFDIVFRPVLLLEKIVKFPFGLSVLTIAEKK